MRAIRGFRHSAPRYPEKVALYLPRGTRSLAGRIAAELGVSPNDLMRNALSKALAEMTPPQQFDGDLTSEPPADDSRANNHSAIRALTRMSPASCCATANPSRFRKDNLPMKLLAFLAALLIGGAAPALGQTPTTFKNLVVTQSSNFSVNPILTGCSGPLFGNGSSTSKCGGAALPYGISPSAAPSSLASWNSPANAFTGDNSKIGYGVLYQISGAASLGQPATGYQYTDELTPSVVYLYNTSGWNQSTSGNVGRTSATAYRTHVWNHGQGDMQAYNATAFVDTAKAGATNFLANPAASLFGGDISAGAAGVYLNPYETIANDNGFDVAYMGIVVNDNRTNNTGTLGVTHMGFRTQSAGTKPMDAGFSASGPYNIGLDLTPITTNSSGSYTKAAIALNSQDRIYFNGTNGSQPGIASSVGSDYIAYNSGVGGLIFVSGNNGSFQVNPGQVTAAVPLAVAAHIISSGSAPSVSACGTSPSLTSATDTKGIITVGTGTVTSCTLTFASAYASLPACVVNASTTAATIAVTVTTSALTITSSSSVGGAALLYHCIQ